VFGSFNCDQEETRLVSWSWVPGVHWQWPC